MKEMFVDQVGIAVGGHPVVLLSDHDSEKVMPIFIGAIEASAISMALGKRKPARPMTHDLLLSVIESLDSKVEKIEIVKVFDNAYHAQLALISSSGEASSIDCRPSDAIAIALRAEAPIFVDPEIAEQSMVPVERTHTTEPQVLQEDGGFRDFVANVKASDFVLPHQKTDMENLNDLIEGSGEEPAEGENPQS